MPDELSDATPIGSALALVPSQELHVFQIEKNVQLPAPKAIYPFAQMEIGDSFVFDEGRRDRISSSAAIYAKKNNAKFRTRRLADGKCRIWRIA